MLSLPPAFSCRLSGFQTLADRAANPRETATMVAAAKTQRWRFFQILSVASDWFSV